MASTRTKSEDGKTVYALFAPSYCHFWYLYMFPCNLAQVATGAFLIDSHYMDPKEHFGHSYIFRSTSGFPTGARCQVPGQGKFDFKTR